ncbi:hypothetical protein AABB87_14385 [Roseateles sp. PN1]|uniref:hypothetical protein n=2 Tax=Roseateles sp. PN1 TaxID=3137372 RepID=UPI00313A17BF
MGHAVIHIHPEAPPKPALGAACNGCGLCCLSEPCPIGMLVSRRRHGACSALRWSDESSRYVCGMLLAPGEVLGWRPQGWPNRHLAPWLARRSRRWIAAGIGCDADLQAETAAELRKD